MDKQDVVRTLEQIASFLELKGENPFRVRAYHTGARAIATFQGDLNSALASGELAEVQGIGPAMLEIAQDVLRTGTSPVLKELQDQVPPGLIEMLKISGLGVAKIRQIHESLHVESLGELEDAARDGRLARLPRFGKKTADNLLKGIRFLRQVSEFRLFHNAYGEAQALLEFLGSMPGVSRAAVAGSVRRRREIIRDLDFVLECSRPPAEILDLLGNAPGVAESLGATEDSRTVRFATGTMADVYLARPTEWGFRLVRATGSAEHLSELSARAAAQGHQWTDEGIRNREDDLLAASTEADVYQSLGLPLIPPELREGNGEVAAAAAGRLPDLIERTDVLGFLHCHSNYSDGTSTVTEWAAACRAAGYGYLGITDHSQSAAYAGGLAPDDIPRQHGEIDDANRGQTELQVLKGVEVDILADGTLDYTPEIRASFDFIIASVHSRLGMGGKEMTDRILRAMNDPFMTILGHPTGRLLLSRDPYPLDLDAVFARAAERGVAVEINADPQRLDLDWTFVRQAVEAGVTISIGADAHSIGAIGNMDVGVGVARKGWLRPVDVLNARPLAGFREFANRRET